MNVARSRDSPRVGEKFFPMVGSISEPAIGTGLLVSKICRGWNAYADLNAYDKDFECYRISRRAPIYLDGVQCGRRDLQAPFSLRWHIFDNWVPRRACAF
jgi:hypothetical protein